MRTSTICHDLGFSRKGGTWRTQIRAKADFVQQQLNATIQAVAAKFSDVGVTDISNHFSGHEICTTDSWIFDGLWRAAHPTQTGQQMIGKAVLALCGTLPGKCAGR